MQLNITIATNKSHLKLLVKVQFYTSYNDNFRSYWYRWLVDIPTHNEFITYE